jgi:hypothetical protein
MHDLGYVGIDRRTVLKSVLREIGFEEVNGITNKSHIAI